MNVAYPPKEFSSASEIVDGLIDLIQGGFENPNDGTGTVMVAVEGYPNLSFLAVFGKTLEIIQPIDGRPIDTKMTFPIATLEMVFRDYEVLDWRSPEMLGNVKLEGDLNLAFHVGISCLRPSDRTVETFARMRALHKRKNHQNLRDVVRLHQPTQHQLLEVIEDGVPAIITGLEPSPPCKDWTIDRMVEKYADSVVCIRSAEEVVTTRELAAQMLEFEENPALEKDPTRDIAYTKGAAMPEEMLGDFGPMFFDREDFGPAQLWLGSVSTQTPATELHCDPNTGFLFQVIGRKRLQLYSADQAECLYPKKAYNHYQPCWFDPSRPDYDRFPKAKDAKALSIILQPGELLVQPAGWFHQVHALESPTMSVSYFWRY